MSYQTAGKTTVETIPFDRAEAMEQLRRASRKAAFLLVIDGLDVGRMIPLLQARTVLGRDPRCDVVLRDDGISRSHAEVLVQPGDRVLVRDMGSTNGTFVAGERVNETLLEEGGKILLGRRTILKFVLQDELDESYQRQMYESSVRDGLTATYNRKYFDNQMISVLSFAKRHALPVTLLIFDLDHFKRVNDEHGHLSGDLVLVAVTEAIGRMIRAEDVLARYGGEEFAIIALGIDHVGGQALAERVRKRVHEVKVRRMDGRDGWLTVTVSIGVATVPPGQTAEPEALIAQADVNLYEAKRSGRDRAVATEMS